MKKVVAIFLCFSIIFASFMAYALISEKSALTGNSVLGSVFLYVFGNAPVIKIDSPLNVTYNFAIGSNLTLDLNVSANQNVSAWWYTLEDLYHNRTVRSNVLFNPNATFAPLRKSNRMTIYANNSFGEIGSKSVIYYVSVPNTAPLLSNITPNLYACEGSLLSYNFNATDPDEDDLQLSLSPTTPFFIFPTSFQGLTFVQSQLFSGMLGKADIGTYNRTIAVTDGQYSDSKSTNISVIEINNRPILSPIGVQTIYSHGPNSTFYKQVSISDRESGTASSGNFSFNLTFTNGNKFFDINHSFGIMNLSGNESIVGTYNLSVCATDQPLAVVSPNISLCGQNGSAITVCNNFSLTITGANRPPTIYAHTPVSLDVAIPDEQSQFFSVYTYDPDGTIPDVYWYFDGAFKQYTQGNNFDNFTTIAFPCNTTGTHILKSEITDGLLNDSVSWTINVSAVICPFAFGPPSGGGGGPIGTGNKCVEKWACTDWSTCQNTQRSLEVGVLGRDDYRLINFQCAKSGFDSAACGMQIRSCNDMNFCNSTYTKPDLVQSCQYTTNPTCSDGIQNCHDGSCEVLVDCGGPCGACPSCSDKIQNQGELGIDCGGPCPNQCPPESPLKKYYFFQSQWFIWSLWILLLILLLILLRRLYLLIKEKREFERDRKIQSIFRGRN